ETNLFGAFFTVVETQLLLPLRLLPSGVILTRPGVITLAEAKGLLNPNDFNNLKIQISENRKHYNFKDYWNDVINECKIKRDISECKVEKEHSSNLDEDLIVQSSSAIDENSTAMQS
ncbi:11037_t:CDS:2, partial [Dentiscutata heterogama]